jgi:uncharacterized membrane protein YphA (DoxX/SURF4 family)
MCSSEVGRHCVWADAGLALPRLGAGLSLFLLFGMQKVKAAGEFTFAGSPWLFVDFNRKAGLPFPILVAYLQTLNESFCTLAVACGALTASQPDASPWDSRRQAPAA